MSVKVDLDQLADALADFTFAYLITVGDDYRAHTVAVDPVLARRRASMSAPSARARGRTWAHTTIVTLVWPPREPGGYTLIVDGPGQPTERRAEGRAHPGGAAPPGSPGAATKPGCKDDCMPLETA